MSTTEGAPALSPGPKDFYDFFGPLPWIESFTREKYLEWKMPDGIVYLRQRADICTVTVTDTENKIVLDVQWDPELDGVAIVKEPQETPLERADEPSDWQRIGNVLATYPGPDA
jgi:hypothetical protein